MTARIFRGERRLVRYPKKKWVWCGPPEGTYVVLDQHNAPIPQGAFAPSGADSEVILLDGLDDLTDETGELDPSPKRITVVVIHGGYHSEVEATVLCRPREPSMRFADNDASFSADVEIISIAGAPYVRDPAMLPLDWVAQGIRRILTDAFFRDLTPDEGWSRIG